MNVSACYVIVCNIPSTFRTADLRNYFSEFVETSKFSCFHYRHRPQAEMLILKSSAPTQGSSEHDQTPKFLENTPSACIVKFEKSNILYEFLKKYHFQNWVDSKDNFLSSRCILVPVKITDHDCDSDAPVYLQSKPLSFSLPSVKLNTFIELNPPVLMPHGNVGTPTKHYLKLIKSCQLPSKLIGKLGLNFPKMKRRKYGNVSYNYKTDRFESDKMCVSGDDNHWPDGDVKSSQPHVKRYETQEDQEEEEEEWDRHEALHDDVTEQERTKERLYEEEEEVVWEKGGPGLVWHTDASFWKQAEGDFDEQTSDDWDVDYSVYFRDGDGDKDARDALEMRQSVLWRQGHVESVFKKPHAKGKPLTKSSKDMSKKSVGSFEEHTKGIGRRLMEKHGWKDGLGLGRSQEGIKEPVHNDGQKPRERKGLGYYGEKLQHFGVCTAPSQRQRKRKSSDPDRIVISTIYDQTCTNDLPESLYNRNPTTSMKYRY